MLIKWFLRTVKIATFQWKRNGIRDLNFIESLECELHEDVQFFVCFVHCNILSSDRHILGTQQIFVE